MCCEIQHYITRRKTARLLAALICVCFIAALLLSSAFIVTHSGHEHDRNGADGGCAVCAHIAAAENLLKTVSVIALIAAVTAFFAARLIRVSTYHTAAGGTPIGQKVRLNN
jgi:hypothetical protein